MMQVAAPVSFVFVVGGSQMCEMNFAWVAKIPIGIMQLRTNLEVMFVNDEAKRLLSFFPVSLYGEIPDMLYERLESAVQAGEVEEGKTQNFVIQSPKGMCVRVCAQGWADTIVLTLEDVTEFEWAKAEERAMREEIDRAFSFSLLEPSVAKKLSCTAEYRDEPAGAGLIKITGVIPDGGYRHVINMLKLAADLGALGLFEFPGMSRDVVTKAAIYHDLCKTQPFLRVGDVVDPKEVFPLGKMHAELGADMARGYYKL